MEPHYIGVDLHKAFFQACALQASGERLWERRFARDGDGVALFREWCGPTAHVAVEACGPTWAFVDVARSLDVCLDARGPFIDASSRLCVKT